ncbi:MAG: NPCBM/NEW2 domain-containing protein [Planctomycetaceae bacterium]|nr:NPCBM/NEW2 domain-containing protein [Planctomycetaceae bacterium]
MSAWRVRVVPFVLCLLTGATAPPAEESRCDANVQLADRDQTAAGSLRSLTSEELRLATRWKEETFSRRDLRSIELPLRRGVPRTESRAAGAKLWVLLTNGDRLAATEATIGDDHLTLSHPNAGEIELGLEFVRAILQPGDDPERNRVVERLVLRGEYAADALLLVNGDRIEGELQDWQDGRCRIGAAAGELNVANEQLRAVVLDPALSVRPERRETWSLVQLTDGSRLSARDVRWVDDQWVMTAEAGFAFTLPCDQVRRVDLFGARVAALSQREPTEYEHLPFLSAKADYAVDRDVTGGPLQSEENDPAWGVGVLSGSRLSWDLDGTWDRLEVRVGVDDAAADRGSVDFIVNVDGVEVCRSGRRTGGDPVIDLGPIPLRSARRLELIVDYADGGDIRDFANWYRPTLLR